MGIETIYLNDDQVFFSDIQTFSSLSPLTRFVFTINQIVKAIGGDPANDKNRLFFRGQANSEWKVEPSIFRKGFLSIEHDIIRASISRSPGDFSNDPAFTQLTKLQHYGLPTRLLDVTHSPLVALYFACKKEMKAATSEEGTSLPVECDGAVYVAYANPELPESIETQVLSQIAKLDLTKMKLPDVITELDKSIEGFVRSIDLREHIPALTRSHFVLADMNNERIIRQSGAFLLCGCINCEIVDNGYNDQSTLSKARADMQSNFSWKIIIDAQDKEAILDELDFFNINEATLFPELEHQLNYITETNRRLAKGTNIFTGLIDVKEIDKTEKHDPQMVLDKKLKEIVDDFIRDTDKSIELVNLFKKHATIDWYKRESVKANIVRVIGRNLAKQNGYSSDKSKEIARLIVDSVIASIYS